MRNKKSLMILRTLVATIFSIFFLFFIVIPACNNVRAYFYSINDSSKSINEFVDGINRMASNPDKTEQFLLLLNDKSAVVGFKKDDPYNYQCYNCYINVRTNMPTVTVLKPSAAECNGKACVCHCDGKFRLQDSTIGGISLKEGKCGSSNELWTCKTLNIDVVDKTIMQKYTDGNEEWKNGFLFVRGISDANDLKYNDKEAMTVYAQKKGDVIGVCNGDMLEFNKKRLNVDECINDYAGSGGSCGSSSTYRCDSGHVYWFNSCGGKENKKEDCGNNGCIGNSCNPPAGCTCSGWSNAGCGGECASNQMKQTRTCSSVASSGACAVTSRCVFDSSCGGSGLAAPITCPLQGTTTITCGTYDNPASNNCGHGKPPEYQSCTLSIYAECGGWNSDLTYRYHSLTLQRSIDVVSSNLDVYLPYLNSGGKQESVTWTRDRILTQIPINGGNWGYKTVYQTNFQGKTFLLDLTHLSSTLINYGISLPSGTLVATLFVSPGWGTHLHLGLKENGNPIDTMSAKICQ